MIYEEMFEQFKEEIREEYETSMCRDSFQQFLKLVENHPYRYTRTAFQLVADMIESYGTRTITDCGEEIVRYKLFDDPFDKGSDEEFGRHAVFGLDRQIHSIVNYVKATAGKGGDERVVLFHGPHATAKTSVIRLMIKGLEQYSRTPRGGLYSFDWIFTEDDHFDDIGFHLDHLDNQKRKSCAKLKDDDIFIRLPCQMNDHPLMLLPKNKRRRYLEAIVEKHSNNIVIPKMIYENELCKNCQTIYSRLLDKYDGDLEKALSHVQVLRLFVSEIEQIGAATVPSGQNIEANAPIIVREGQWYQNLASLFPGISVHQFQGKWVDANRGILHFTDMFKNGAERHHNLLAAVQEHIQDFNGVQATVDTVTMGTTNIEEWTKVRVDPKNKALRDRTRVFDIPYVVNINDEMLIYSDKFVEAGYKEEVDSIDEKHVMPHIKKFVSTFSVLTRLFKPRRDYFEERGIDLETLDIIDQLSPIQKAYIYAGELPPDMERFEKKLISNPYVQKLLRQEYNPIDGVKIQLDPKKKQYKITYEKEGMGGMSPRMVKDIITDVIGTKEDKEANGDKQSCLGINEFHDNLERLIETGSDFIHVHYSDDRYLNAPRLLFMAKKEYDMQVINDVKWSIIGMPKSKIDEKVLEYIDHVQAWADNTTIYNPKTQKDEKPSEKKMQWLENILGLDKKEVRESHRMDVIIQLSRAYKEARTEAEKMGMDLPQLDILDLYSDYYEFIYDHLLEDRLEEMPINKEEFIRGVGWLDTDKEKSLNPLEKKELDKVMANLKKKAPYCDRCAKSVLKYVFFDLQWFFNDYY